jgi:hypothetical protein
LGFQSIKITPRKTENKDQYLITITNYTDFMLWYEKIGHSPIISSRFVKVHSFVVKRYLENGEAQ